MKRILVFCSAGLIVWVIYAAGTFLQERFMGGYFPRLTGLFAVGVAGLFLKVAMAKGWTSEEVPTLFAQEDKPDKLEFR